MRAVSTDRCLIKTPIVTISVIPRYVSLPFTDRHVQLSWYGLFRLQKQRNEEELKKKTGTTNGQIEMTEKYSECIFFFRKFHLDIIKTFLGNVILSSALSKNILGTCSLLPLAHPLPPQPTTTTFSLVAQGSLERPKLWGLDVFL